MKQHQQLHTSLSHVGPILESPVDLKSIYSMEFRSNISVGAGQSGMISLWNLQVPGSNDDENSNHNNDAISRAASL